MPHADAAAIIPARFASTRLPGKPLLDRTGKPMVCHVADRARAAARIARVLIATDDPRIARAAADHGHDAVMTRPDHPNGTSRLAEAAHTLDPDLQIIVNVQGDEPEIDPALIDALVDRLAIGDEPMATIASPFAPGENPDDPNIVKVVCDTRSRAMYFSRARIPFDRDTTGAPALKHAGIYAYRRAFLDRYVALAPTPAEQAEQLEQLRALEHGHAIGVLLAHVAHTGIDTPDQYDAFVRRHRGR